MKVRGDQGDLSSAFQFPHPNKSESILQRGLFIVLYFLSSSSVAAHQQRRFLPYGGRLSRALAVVLGGIPLWRQRSCTPFEDPLKAPPDCHLKYIKRKKNSIMRTSYDSCQTVSRDFHLPSHVLIILSDHGCIDSQSPMVSPGSSAKLLVTLNSSHWLSRWFGLAVWNESVRHVWWSLTVHLTWEWKKNPKKRTWLAVCNMPRFLQT